MTFSCTLTNDHIEQFNYWATRAKLKVQQHAHLMFADQIISMEKIQNKLERIPMQQPGSTPVLPAL